MAAMPSLGNALARVRIVRPFRFTFGGRAIMKVHAFFYCEQPSSAWAVVSEATRIALLSTLRELELSGAPVPQAGELYEVSLDGGKTAFLVDVDEHTFFTEVKGHGQYANISQAFKQLQPSSSSAASSSSSSSSLAAGAAAVDVADVEDVEDDSDVSIVEIIVAGEQGAAGTGAALSSSAAGGVGSSLMSSKPKAIGALGKAKAQPGAGPSSSSALLSSVAGEAGTHGAAGAKKRGRSALEAGSGAGASGHAYSGDDEACEGDEYSADNNKKKTSKKFKAEEGGQSSSASSSSSSSSDGNAAAAAAAAAGAGAGAGAALAAPADLTVPHCYHCPGLAFESWDAAQKHQKLNHKQVEDARTGEMRDRKASKDCEDCGIEVRSHDLGAYTDHRIRHGTVPNPYVCPKCGTEFISSKGFKGHAKGHAVQERLEAERASSSSQQALSMGTRSQKR